MLSYNVKCDSMSINCVQSICRACQLGKTHKLPFFLSINKFETPLDIVHLDIWGLLPILFSLGFRQYIHFTDAFFHFSWIYFLKKNSYYQKAFLLFKEKVELLIGKCIKTLQSHGGGEYDSLNNMLNLASITRHVSYPYTPQHNGLVKIRYCQIFKK